jgi:hypothetical protein
MREKIAALRSNLISTLRTQFEKEIQRSLNRIEAAMAPYTRFVRAEKNSLLETQTTLQNLQNELKRLKAAIERL